MHTKKELKIKFRPGINYPTEAFHSVNCKLQSNTGMSKTRLLLMFLKQILLHEQLYDFTIYH